MAEVRCAVLYEKPRSAVKCEYVWRRTDRWITFPWSADDGRAAEARLVDAALEASSAGVSAIPVALPPGNSTVQRRGAP